MHTQLILSFNLRKKGLLETYKGDVDPGTLPTIVKSESERKRKEKERRVT